MSLSEGKEVTYEGWREVEGGGGVGLIVDAAFGTKTGALTARDDRAWTAGEPDLGLSGLSKG
jgi:hypothetical protein